MQVSFSNVAITGIACCVPKEIFHLSSLSDQFPADEIDRIIKNTGIHSTRIAKNEIRTSDLCEHACKKLLQEMQMNSADIDGIIFVSQTPDQKMPATSVVLQSRLGLSNECVTFDLNYGCSGYIYGLYMASMLINSGGCNRILLFAGDVLPPPH